MKKHTRSKSSEETKKKQSISIKLFWESPEGKVKKQRLSKMMTERMKGKTYEQLYGDRAESIKNKIKISESGKILTENHKRKISESKKGKKRPPCSKEWREKLGRATRGKTYEEIYGDRAEIEKDKRGAKISGKNSYMWKDGSSSEPYPLCWNRKLKKNIRKRDNFICKVCGKENSKIIHHIDYDKNNCNPENLITLCRSCHSKTNFNRENWIAYFKKFSLPNIIIL